MNNTGLKVLPSWISVLVSALSDILFPTTTGKVPSIRFHALLIKCEVTHACKNAKLRFHLRFHQKLAYNWTSTQIYKWKCKTTCFRNTQRNVYLVFSLSIKLNRSLYHSNMLTVSHVNHTISNKLYAKTRNKDLFLVSKDIFSVVCFM